MTYTAEAHGRAIARTVQPLVVCPFAAEGTCHVSAQCGHSIPHERRTGNDDPCGWGDPDRGCPDCRTHTGKLYGRLGGAFIETGYHTSDVDELTAAVKRLEAESSRLREALSDLICVASMCDNWDEFPSAAIDKANKALEARNAS